MVCKIKIGKKKNLLLFIKNHIFADFGTFLENFEKSYKSRKIEK